MRACFYAHCNKCSCECINVVTELCICSCVIKRCVFKSKLIGEFLNHSVKNLRKCLFNKLLFFPYKFTGMCLVVVVFLLVCFVLNGLHETLVMGQNDFKIFNRFKPLGIPFNADKTVVINRAKSIHHILDRHCALADEGMLPCFLCVSQVNELNICTEVGNRFFRILTADEVCFVHVPVRTDKVACEVVHQVAKSCCVGKNTRRFNKNDYIVLFALCDSLANELYSLVVSVLAAIGVKLNIGNVDVACNGDCRIHFFNIPVRGVGRIAV